MVYDLYDNDIWTSLCYEMHEIEDSDEHVWTWLEIICFRFCPVSRFWAVSPSNRSLLNKS